MDATSIPRSPAPPFASVVPQSPSGVPHPFAPPRLEDGLHGRNRKALVSPLSAPFSASTVFQKSGFGGPNLGFAASGPGWQDLSMLPVRPDDLQRGIEQMQEHVDERLAEHMSRSDVLLAEVRKVQENQERMQNMIIALGTSRAMVGAADGAKSNRLAPPERGSKDSKKHGADKDEVPDTTGHISTDGRKIRNSFTASSTLPYSPAKEDAVSHGELDYLDYSSEQAGVNIVEVPPCKPQGRSVPPAHIDIEEAWDPKEANCCASYRSFQDLVRSAYFDYTVGVFIVLNAILLSIQLDWKVRALAAATGAPKEPSYISGIETAFACIFTLELISRVTAEGLKFVCSAWNWLDLIVVTAALFEEAMKYGLGSETIGGKLSIIRIMRVAKLLRTLRIIRVVRVFRELRIVIMSITKSLRALFWTMILLSVLLYFMSVLVLVEASTTDSLFKGDSASRAQRMQFIPNLPQTLLTVYQCTTGGLEWERVSTSLRDVVPYSDFLWVCYIGLVVFAIMNTVTGIFVDQAMKSAHDDDKNVALEEFEKRDSLKVHLTHALREAIVMGRNSLDRSSMMRLVKDRKLQEMLHKCDIEPRDMFSFFDIVAGSSHRLHTRQIGTFVNLAFRLKGFSRNIELMALSFHLKNQAAQIQSAIDHRPAQVFEMISGLTAAVAP